MINTSKGHHRILAVTGMALIAIYLVNCFSPLRLTIDTVRYFHLKEWMESNTPGSAPDFLPYGYALFLRALSAIQICNATMISFFHLGFLLGSLSLVSTLFPRVSFWKLCVISLFNWTILKFVITPLSEMQFLFFSMLSLAAFERWRMQKTAWWLVACLCSCAAAILTRTAGWALVPAFLVGYLAERGSALRIRPWRIFLPACAIIVLLVAFSWPHLRDYYAYFSAYVLQYGLGSMLFAFKKHLVDFAALVVNAPATHIPLVPGKAVEIIYLLAGMLGITFIGYRVLSKTQGPPAFVKTYIATYLAMIFVWPYFEPRFFVPLIPLLVVMSVEWVPRTTFLRSLRYVVFACYVSAGFFALGYYTLTSWDKRSLAVRQDSGIWRNEYETFFFGKPLSDTATVVKPDIIRLLRRYD